MTSIESDGFGGYKAAGILLASIEGYCMGNMPLVIAMLNIGPNTPVYLSAGIDAPRQAPTVVF